MKIVVEPNRKIDGNDAGAFYANSFQSIGKTYSLMQFTPTNSVLSDNRSRIIINFCKGSAKIEGTQTDLVNDFQIIGNAVSLEGMGNDAQMWYYPVTRQIEIPSDAATPMILPMTDRRAENLTVRDELGNDNYLYYSTELYVPSCILINRGKAEILSYLSRKYGYTISDDVTSLIVDGTTVLRLRGQLQQGERQFGVSFGLTNLVDELMPMHTYVFNLILKSNYIEVTLHLYGHNVHSWSEVGDLDYEFGEPRHINLGTISLGADSHDWSGVSDEYAFGD